MYDHNESLSQLVLDMCNMIIDCLLNGRITGLIPAQIDAKNSKYGQGQDDTEYDPGEGAAAGK